MIERLFKTIKKTCRAMVRNFILAADKNFKPMIVVLVDGGLGSQMWQYSLGRLAAMKSGLPVCYDLSWFERDGMDINKKYSRAYRLETVFPNVRLENADAKTAETYRKYFNLYPGTRRDYDEKVIASRNARYIGGYYVNAKYVDLQGDALRDELTFGIELSDGNGKVRSAIESTPQAVAIHIRRGDYVGSVHDVTTPKYFTDAVKFIAAKLSPEKAVFFVFSNGMEWSRKILEGLDEKFVFVENNDNDSGEADMFLMSRCAHFVISNSSFSWWPAWLSRRSADKIVVAPNVWLSGERVSDRLSMLSEGWLAMPV